MGNFLRPPSLRKIRKKYRNKKKGRRQKKIQKEKDFLKYREENPEENITFSYCQNYYTFRLPLTSWHRGSNRRYDFSG